MGNFVIHDMEIYSRCKNAHISPQKCRLVADQIRGIPVGRASNVLAFSRKKAAVLIKKVLNTAIANAEDNEGIDIDELYVARIYVNEGPTMKRMRARAKGRGSRILKRTSIITVVVSRVG